MEKETFYEECARVLGTQHDYKTIPQYGHNGRWGPRQPGNGRFPGFGTIRWFGPTCIVVSLTNPVAMTRTFKSPEEALKALVA